METPKQVTEGPLTHEEAAETGIVHLLGYSDWKPYSVIVDALLAINLNLKRIADNLERRQ